MTTALVLFSSLVLLDETPAKTIQGFVDAFNARDSAGLSRRIVGQKSATLPKGVPMPTLVAKIGATRINGNAATVEVHLDVRMKGPSQGTMKSHEFVQLRRAGSDWQIVPVDPNRRSALAPGFFPSVAYALNHPETLAMAKPASSSSTCLSNTKQLSLATILCSADHNDILPKTAGWKKAILPYVKDERIFRCPGDKSGKDSYFLESRVAGKSMMTFANPGETAMIVEGAAGKTAFRHNGTASLAYLDGHAKIVRPDQMRRARQTPLK